ncbi:MAG: DUF6273 domain-containing protein [Roseburia sp.]|nr:DUF6273 domain-containing protein [Roseburia sp.]
MREQQRKQVRGKKPLALFLTTALCIGILASGELSVSKAVSTPDSETETSTSNSDITLKNPTTSEDGVTTWDCVYFGHYWQEDTNGDGKVDKDDEKQPIKWRVLSVKGDEAFLLADKNLDVQKYNDTNTSITWETCTMRSWLNGYGATANVCGNDYSSNNFLNNAFTESEQAAIKNMTVINEENPEHHTEGGNDTIDKIYLLSISEVMNPSYGFTLTTNPTDTRKAAKTAYVVAGGEINSTWMDSGSSTTGWWLRSPGINSKCASSVTSIGDIGNGGNVGYNFIAVRPALHLNLQTSSDVLSTSSWSYAGTVTATGGEIGETSPTAAPPTPTPIAAPTTAPAATPNSAPTSAVSSPSAIPSPSSEKKTVTAKKKKTLKLSGIKCLKNSKVISGKISVSKATVKIKVEEKTWKKAEVKGKNFTLKLSSKLKKKTKITIKVTKKGYKNLVKTIKLK